MKRKPRPAPPKPENERRRRFVELYMGACAGNATKAYIGAGYSTKGAAQSAHSLLRNPDIRRELEKRVKADPRVATREERQAWWSAVMRGDGVFIEWRETNRLSASALLARSQGDFKDEAAAALAGSLAELVKAAYVPPSER